MKNISFRSVLDNQQNLSSIQIQIDGKDEGEISRTVMSDLIYWKYKKIDTFNLDIVFNDFDEAKNHCYNSLNVLLNGVNPKLIIGKQLAESLSREKERLAQNQQVPIDELKKMVLCTYNAGGITEGRAMQLLNIDRLEFRRVFQSWLGESH